MGQPMSDPVAHPDRRVVEAAQHVLGRAALMHPFDPLALMPGNLDPTVKAAALALVAQHATEVEWPPKDRRTQDGGTRTLWRLDPEARRRELARLIAEQRLGETIALHGELPDDEFARYLRSALQSELRPADVPPEERNSANSALSFARDALPKETSESAARAAVELRALLSRQAEENRINAILPGRLFGRERERAALDTYVATGAVPPSDRLRDPGAPAVQVRGYLLTGSPGSGKSALVTDLVRRRRGYATPANPANGPAARLAARAVAAVGQLMRTERVLFAPVILLDFDRPAIALGGELEWTTELTRQLAYGYPQLDRALGERRAKVRQIQAQIDPTGTAATFVLTITADMKKGVADELRALGMLGSTLVLVVDTFEEVLVRSLSAAPSDLAQTLFGRLLLWADSLASLTDDSNRSVFGAVRVVVSGRVKPALDPVELGAWFVGHHAVGPLEPDAAVDFLRSRDEQHRFDRARARRAVEAIGGHPLNLIMLERRVRYLPDEKIEQELREVSIVSMLGGEEGTRVLYSRYLWRMHHDAMIEDGVTPEMVRAAAFPGLVLREVTPDLLREVIGPAAELPALNPVTAQALFYRLVTQMWLVEKVPGRDIARHKPDVRRLMLPMMIGNATAFTSEDARDMATMGEHVAAVRKRAIVWFERAASELPSEPDRAAARTEAAYHRAFLDEPPFADFLSEMAVDAAAALCRRVADLAGEDMLVMPLRARALLRFHQIGASRLSPDELAALPDNLKKRAGTELLERAAGQDLTRGSSVVLSLLERLRLRIGASVAMGGAGDDDDAPSDDEEDSSIVDPHVRGLIELADFYSSLGSPAVNFNSANLMEILRDRTLAAEIGLKFKLGAFEEAAEMGKRALDPLSELPDLSAAWPLPDDPVNHWLWQVALSCLAANDEGTPPLWIEDLLIRFARETGGTARADALGAVLAAATTIALGADRVSAKAEQLERLADIVIRPSFTVKTHAGLRVLALHPLWRRDRAFGPRTEFGPMRVRLPLNHLRFFDRVFYERDFISTVVADVVDSTYFDRLSELTRMRPAFPPTMEPPNLAEIYKLWDFAQAHADKRPTSDEVDAAVPSVDQIVAFNTSRLSSAENRPKLMRLLSGLVPELRDLAVRVLDEVDRKDPSLVEPPCADVSKRALLWPSDLLPHNVPTRDRDRRSGLIARIVVHADRCGLLGSLLEQVSTSSGDLQVRRVATLVSQYDALRGFEPEPYARPAESSGEAS
jgi:hypothetical protein